jgi:hypothetical protein
MGVIFMIAVLKPTGSLLVQDDDNKSPTFNQHVPLNDVPFAIGFPSWFLSTSEKSIKTLVGKYASPIVNTADYNTIGGELSYNLLLNMQGIASSVKKVEPMLYQDVSNYMRYCVNVALTQGWITYESLENPGEEALWDKLKITKQYPLFGFPAGKDNCAALYNSLNVAFEQAKDKILTDFCQSNGYTENTYSYQACNRSLTGVLKTHFNKDNIFKFIYGYIAVDAGANVVKDYMNLAEKQVDVSNTMSAFTAEKWMPKLRSTTVVVVILLAPFCFLLIFFSPGGVIKWYGGMYVWLILWSGIDQFMYMKYQNDIYDVYQVMRSSGLGVNDMLNIHYPILEPLGMYGKMRWIAMTLALAMCMGILKIGNHAMVSIAEGIGQVMQQSAGQAAGQLSGAGGTDAAMDRYVREKARGWAAGMTDVQAIANQEIYNYQSGIESVAQRTALGITPQSEAAADAYNKARGIRHVENLLDRGITSDTLAQLDTIGTQKNLAAIRGGLKAAGGLENYLEQEYRKNGWDFSQTQANLNEIRSHFNSDEEAAAFLGETSAMSAYVNGKGILGFAGAYGIENYANDKAEMDRYNYRQSQGVIASDKDQAAALGLSPEEFARFRNNRFNLDGEMAASLNKKYDTDEFRKGQTLSFEINKDGEISNMTARSAFKGTVDGYSVNGNETLTFGNDGDLLSISYDGVINGSQGHLLTDGEGNTLVYKGEYGASYQNVFNAVIAGNSAPFAKAQEIYGRVLKTDTDTFTDAEKTADELGRIYRKDPSKENLMAYSEAMQKRNEVRHLAGELTLLQGTSGYNAEVSALAISLNEGFGRYVHLTNQSSASWSITDSLGASVTLGYKIGGAGANIEYSKTYKNDKGELVTESFDDGIKMFDELTRYAIQKGLDPAEVINQGMGNLTRKPFKPH